MCGILAVFNKSQSKDKEYSANNILIDLYQNQYSRGQKGFGIIRINNKQEVEVDRACEPTKFLLDLYMKQAPMIIAHHRMPTSTDNTIDQTHPISVSNKSLKHDYLIVHNGIISNDYQLRTKHKELGFNYTTEYRTTNYYQHYESVKWNDSEALAIELALFIEKKIKAVGTDNQAAFIILQLDKKTGKATRVYFGKNKETADLTMFKSKFYLELASENAGEDIEANKLFSFKPAVKEIKLKEEPIPFLKNKIAQLPTKSEFTNNKTSTPVSTTTAITTTSKETEKEKEEEQSRPYRNWVGAIADIQEGLSIDELPEYVDKNHIVESCKDLQEKIAKASSEGITHLIDDALDSEMELVTDLMTEYKASLLQDYLEKDEEEFWLQQITRVLITMRAITNIADKAYETKSLEEEVKEYNNLPEEDETVGKPVHQTSLLGSPETMWDDEDRMPYKTRPAGF